VSVRIRHPQAGEAEVASSAVAILRESGWEPVPGQDDMGEELPAELRRFEGQDVVRIRHPVSGGEAEVAASAVPQHRSQGWEVVDDEPEAEKPDDDGLDGLTVAELQDYARGAGLPVSGTKAELLKRLRSEPPAEPASEEGEEG